MPNNDAYTQVTQIEQARLDGAKAIILCPLDETMLADSIQTLRDDNIPLAYTTLFDTAYGVQGGLQQLRDWRCHRQAGRANLQQEHTDRAQVVVLSRLGLPAADNRADGMEVGFRSHRARRARCLGASMAITQDLAYAAVQKLIDDDIHFNVILRSATRALTARSKRCRKPNFDPNSVIVVSANGESYAQELIRDGQFLRGTVAANLEASSQIAVDAVVKMLAGSPVPEFHQLPPRRRPHPRRIAGKQRLANLLVVALTRHSPLFLLDFR